jgi:hypothetical protein
MERGNSIRNGVSSSGIVLYRNAPLVFIRSLYAKLSTRYAIESASDREIMNAIEKTAVRK